MKFHSRFTSFIIVLFTSSLFWISCQEEKPPKVLPEWNPNLFDEAVQEFSSKKFKEAALKFEKIVEVQPGNHFASTFAARSYARSGDSSETFNWIKKSIELGQYDYSNRDFSTYHSSPTFKKLMKEGREKLDALQKVPFKPFQILPSNYDPKKSYPLLVFLMGYGGDHEIPANSFFHAFADSQQVIWMVLRGDMVIGKGAYGWNLSEAEMDRVKMDIKNFKESHSVSKKILYGFNQGSRMVYRLGFNYPKEFPRLLTYSQSPLPDDIPETLNLNGVKLFNFCGYKKLIPQYKKAFDANSPLMKSGIKVNTNWEYSIGRSYPINSGPSLVEAIKWLN